MVTNNDKTLALEYKPNYQVVIIVEGRKEDGTKDVIGTVERNCRHIGSSEMQYVIYIYNILMP